MKAIPIKTKTVVWPEYVDRKLIEPCGVRPDVMVGSVACRNCKSFDAYDEGKGTVVLCAHPDQTKGQYVHE